MNNTLSNEYTKLYKKVVKSFDSKHNVFYTPINWDNTLRLKKLFTFTSDNKNYCSTTLMQFISKTYLVQEYYTFDPNYTSNSEVYNFKLNLVKLINFLYKDDDFTFLQEQCKFLEWMSHEITKNKKIPMTIKIQLIINRKWENNVIFSIKNNCHSLLKDTLLKTNLCKRSQFNFDLIDKCGNWALIYCCISKNINYNIFNIILQSTEYKLLYSSNHEYKCPVPFLMVFYGMKMHKPESFILNVYSDFLRRDAKNRIVFVKDSSGSNILHFLVTFDLEKEFIKKFIEVIRKVKGKESVEKLLKSKDNHGDSPMNLLVQKKRILLFEDILREYL